jgi:hypothetical protein
MVLLDGDVARLRVRAVDLVFLLDHHRCETSSSSRVTENVTHVVVTKHKRGTVMAARCMISEDVHLGCTGFAFAAAQSRAREGLTEQRNA